MGMHCGVLLNADVTVDPASGRAVYSGEGNRGFGQGSEAAPMPGLPRHPAEGFGAPSQNGAPFLL